MGEHWTERLSAFLDGDLSPAEQGSCATHLEACAECRSVLADLKRVHTAVATLPGQLPDGELWPGISRQIGVSRGRTLRRLTFSVPQVAAAAIILMALGASVTTVVLRHGPSHENTAATGQNPEMIPVMALDAGVDPAVAQLQRVLEEGRDRLDSATVRVLEENLRIIDRAVEDARAAVARDPANPYLTNHLARTMRRKIDLLRWAADMVDAAIS